MLHSGRARQSLVTLYAAATGWGAVAILARNQALGTGALGLASSVAVDLRWEEKKTHDFVLAPAPPGQGLSSAASPSHACEHKNIRISDSAEGLLAHGESSLLYSQPTEVINLPNLSI